MKLIAYFLDYGSVKQTCLLGRKSRRPKKSLLCSRHGYGAANYPNRKNFKRVKNNADLAIIGAFNLENKLIS